MIATNIPLELRQRHQWIGWVGDKIPLGKSNDPRTWSTFEAIYSRLERKQIAGLGFVFSKDDPYVGIDLDDCRSSDGTLTELAQAILSQIPGYAEISPSGRGVHIITTGRWPDKGRHWPVNAKRQLEVYSEVRYFTMTGHVLRAAETFPDATQALAALHDAFWPATPSVPTQRRYATTEDIPSPAALVKWGLENIAKYGGRNNCGIRLACHILDNKYFGEEGLRILLDYQRQCGYGEEEARRTWRSAQHYPRRAAWARKVVPEWTDTDILRMVRRNPQMRAIWCGEQKDTQRLTNYLTWATRGDARRVAFLLRQSAVQE